MRKIVLVSYTPKDAGGGVPRWNRDFIAGFPGTVHYSWTDFLRDQGGVHMLDIPEWEKAHILSSWLRWSKRVVPGDIVVADGFWGVGYEPENTVCVRHGIWSHLTKEMADAGMKPEFPAHHAVQVDFTRKHIERGGKVVAVSDFISRQCQLQWGFEMGVINNGIDLQKFHPVRIMPNWTESRLVIHGVTTGNKGFDHIQALKDGLPGDDVMLLDDAAKWLEMEDRKYEALANAELVVQPSAYEGNSYFVLETLACGVPIVAYNVGLLNSISEICHGVGIDCRIGCVIDRKYRSPAETLKVTRFILDSVTRDPTQYNPRQVAELFGMDRFHREWREFLQREFQWS